VLAVEVTDKRGSVVFGVDTDGLGAPLPKIDEPRTVTIRFDRTWLLDGEFPVSLKLTDRASGEVIDWREGVVSFEVTSAGRAAGTVALDVTID
jgi:hypothetical protein